MSPSVESTPGYQYPVWFGAVRVFIWSVYWKWLSGADFSWQPTGSVIDEDNHDCGYMNYNNTWNSTEFCEDTLEYTYVCESEAVGKYILS